MFELELENPLVKAVGQNTFQILENFWRKVIDLSDHVLNDLTVKHLPHPALSGKILRRDPEKPHILKF